MASTYTTSLKIQKIGTGEQSGVWGTSTNTNWDLIEQAVTGVQAITMINADYTLTDLNGVSDEARNAVLVVSGTNSAVRKIVAPLVNKTYVVFNNTSGGYSITIGGSSGVVATVPNGSSVLVYCDGVNFYSGISGSAGNFSVAGNEVVAGSSTIGTTLAVGTNLTVGGTTTLTGNATAPTQAAADNSTKVATTAFVTNAVSTATGSLGTMSTQNANNVNITGGTMSGMTSIADTLGAVRSVPINAKTSSYVLTATDNGQCVTITTGGVTVPASIFSNGNAVTIYNNSATAQTITQGTSANMYLAGVGTTGNRTLQGYGLCTVLCVASNTFVISGAGVY